MDKLLNKILLATDGSEDAERAARAAVDLSHETGAELHVVHAWHTVPSPHFKGLVNTAFKEDARELLNKQTEKIEAAGGTVAEDHLVKDSAAQAIVALAAEIDADLIVMGSRGNGPVKRLLLGSVSEGVVHHTHVPVLLLRGEDDAWPPVRVVVGEDSSEDARRAGEFAARLAGIFEAEVLLAYVVPLQNMVLRAESQGKDVVDVMMRRTEEHLSEQAEELKSSSGLSPRTKAVMGYPALSLVGIAEEEKRTLLVIGSRGLNATKRAMLGSVSSNVLKTVESPVLVVPPPERQEDSS